LRKSGSIAFATDQIGGLATPNLSISGISRKFGPVGGDPTSFAQGNFDPASYFNKAVLLGGITLLTCARFFNFVKMLE
jgi:hypothetical protein